VTSWYDLDKGNNPVPLDRPSPYANAPMGSDRACVGKTDIVDGMWVSTVFLGLDHNPSGDGGPVLWETLIFADGYPNIDQEMWRYTSYEEAVDGHEAAVALARSFVPVAKQRREPRKAKVAPTSNKRAFRI